MSGPPHSRPLYQYAKLVGEKGTEQEKLDLANDIRVMRELRETFPGSSWEPMEHVILIDWLFNGVAGDLSRHRYRVALQQKFKSYQGKFGRTLEEELGYVRGELALQVILGLPLGQPRNKEDARIVGNAGRGHVAYIPLKNPLSHKLIVNPKYLDHFYVWLVVPEGSKSYRVTGWVTAKEAKEIGEHKRDWPRPGSDAYWVHPALLHSVREWWDQWSG